jgi:spore germination protein GerM
MSASQHHSSFAVFKILAVCTFYMLIPGAPHISSALDHSGQNSQINTAQHADKAIVQLYFSTKKNSFLIAEERKLSYATDPARFGQTIIAALIQGPTKGLMRTIPSGTKLLALFVDPDGTAYVDLTATLKDAHPGGIQSEQMTIFSIVNSLILNIPEINAVKILIDGRESTTLAGHIDLRFPFKTNMLLIR